MCFSSPSIPAAPPPPPSITPAQVDSAREASDLDYRRRLASMKGRQSTILTGQQGVAAPAFGAPKTLLGS